MRTADATASNAERTAPHAARVGSNILLVQGAGGNSSVKDGDVLWVKASGTWLADSEDKDIFVPVALSSARAALMQGDERVPLAPNAGTSLRASIETSLHALMIGCSRWRC